MKPSSWSETEDVRYPAVRPIFPRLEDVSEFLAESRRLRFFSNFGPASIAFERACEGLWFDGSRSSVLCANATSGLTAALSALRVTGSVAIPAYTFAATEAAVRHAGLQPLVVDVDRVISPSAIRSAGWAMDIGAVVAVRPHGTWSDLGEVAAAAKDIGAALIIDNAAGLGVGRSVVDAFSIDTAVEVFSLHATKPFAVGEAGLIVGPSHLEDEFRSALNFGLWARGTLPPGRGFNGKASELTAATALATFRMFPAQRANRMSRAKWFRERLVWWPSWRELNPVDLEHSSWPGFPVIAPEGTDVPRIVTEARKRGLVLRRYYYPALGSAEDAPFATHIANRSLSIPIYGDMSEEEASAVWSIFEDVAK